MKIYADLGKGAKIKIGKTEIDKKIETDTGSSGGIGVGEGERDERKREKQRQGHLGGSVG